MRSVIQYSCISFEKENSISNSNKDELTDKEEAD
jgi:hypothetical protein